MFLSKVNDDTMVCHLVRNATWLLGRIAYRHPNILTAAFQKQRLMSSTSGRLSSADTKHYIVYASRVLHIAER